MDKVKSLVKKYEKNVKKIQLITFLILAILVVVVAVLAPYIVPKDPFLAEMGKSLQKPSAEHIFGTDILGRDLFSRVIYGSRYSLFITLILVATIFAVGTFLGVIAGYFGGLVDMIIMRIGDMMIAFPGLILAIAIAGLLGPSVSNAIIAISSVAWTKYARLSRSMVIKVKQELYVEAAKVTGTKDLKILLKYIIPNMITAMIVTAVSDLGILMLEVATLSFLGFGAQPPIPEWGAMLNEGRTYLAKAPWIMMYPGIAIVIAVVIFNMLGDSVRDLIDEK